MNPRHARHDSDFIPTKPRRSFHDEDGEASCRSASRKRIPRLERVEKPLSSDDLEVPGQARMAYNMPASLSSNIHGSASDSELSDMSCSSEEDESLDSSVDEVAGNLAAYMKRYQHSKSEEHSFGKNHIAEYGR